MGGKAIKFNEKLFSDYKYAKVRVVDVHNKYLGWTRECKNIKTDTALVVASINDLGISISELSVKLYRVAKIGDVSLLYSNSSRSKKTPFKLGLKVDEENIIDKYKQARDLAISNLKVQLLQDTISNMTKQDLLEMYINHQIDIFDFQDVLFLKNINIAVERIFGYENSMSNSWKTMYSSQFRTKMFSELGEFLSDYFEGVTFDIGSLPKDEKLSEFHFSGKFKNKVFAKGLKMCITLVGKNNRIIEIKDEFTELLMLEFSKLGLIKMRGMSLGISDVPVITHYEVKILPEARRMLGFCQRKELIK